MIVQPRYKYKASRTGDVKQQGDTHFHFFYFGATAPIWALAYLHETLRFTSVY
jgi:hypothetical protein